MSRFELVDVEMTAATLALNIRNVAHRRGVSLNRLSVLSGVSRSQLYRILNGASSTSIRWISKISATLEVEPWKMLKPGPVRLHTQRK